MRGLERGLVQPLSDTGRADWAAQMSATPQWLESALRGHPIQEFFVNHLSSFFIMDRSFLHFPAFASPFFSVALRISVGLYFLCFYVKMNKESKRKVIFISHCILTRQWGTYGMGISSPPSWFSFQTIRTLPTSLFWDTIQNQLNWRS